MKKIISMVAALSMMITAAATLNVASATETTPSLKAEVVNVSDASFVTGTTFEVKVTYDGVPVSENEEDWAGTAMTVLQFELDLPGYGTKYTTNGKTYAVDALGTASSNGATKNLVKEELYYSYSWAGPVGADAAYRVGSGDVLTLKFKVTADMNPIESFDIRTATAKIETKDYDASESLVGGALYMVNDDPENGVDKLNVSIVQNTTTSTVESAAVGENEVLDEESADAQAYVSIIPLKSGDKVYWTNSVNDKKVEATLPIIDAEQTKLGLIVLGDASALGTIKAEVVTSK